MAKTKRVDPIKQREKRAKIMAGVGVVLLLAVGGYEIPSIMKGTKPAAAPPPPSTTISLPTSPNLPGSSASAAPTAENPYGNPDAIPVLASNNQLVSFSLFESKNPFRPQVTTPTTTTPADTPGTTPTDTTTTPTSTTPAGTVVPPTGPSATPTSTGTTPTASAPTVTILVNGSKATVAAEGTFPSSSPVFRLASFTSTSAQVGIVGGSYAAGGATLTLQLNKPVTLENTTDGKRYTLELVATH